MIIKIDEKDKKILFQLQLDSRQTYSQIAKKVRLTKEVVRYRIKRLEDLRIILQYTAVINARKIGQESYRWYVQLENTDRKKLQSIIETLVANPYCVWVATCTGRWDLIALFAAYSPRHFEALRNAVLFKYSSNIREHQFAIALEVYFFKTQLFGTTETHTFSFPYWGGEEERMALDEEDIKTLADFCKDPKQSTAGIARHHNFSFELTRNRILRMQKSGLIQGTSISINYALLGFETYKVFFNLKKTGPEKDQELIRYLSSHPNAAEVIRCLGNWDIEFNLIVQNSFQYHEIMMELKDRFAGTISNYISTQVFDNFKYNLFSMADELLKKK